MGKEIFFKNVEVGAEIPPLIKHPTTRQLVMWAGASRDFAEIHYDWDFAVERGLPSPVVHGDLKAAFLGQFITDWVGEAGTLEELKCSYRGLDLPGADLICKGKIVKKYIEGDRYLVDLDLWTENPSGERTTLGRATVALHS